MSLTEEKETLLEVKNLKTSFQTLRGKVTAVDGVSFQVNKGEILGIVGESGCGKSVTSQSIMRLYDEKELVSYEGEILFHGENILEKTEKQMESIRGMGISMVFQDSLSSLDPLYTVGDQIVEMIRAHKKTSKQEAWKHAENMLRLTGIPAPEERVHAYPHEMSGGMRQRAMIAMALACEPSMLIADEPTTALDVTIQAQIMDLIMDLNQRFGMGIMLITHDLGVVAQTCQRVIIMYLGHIVETLPGEDVSGNAVHPYTRALDGAQFSVHMDPSKKIESIESEAPSPLDVPTGCPFQNRCEHCMEICKKEMPKLNEIAPGHETACFYVEKAKKQTGGI